MRYDREFSPTDYDWDHDSLPSEILVANRWGTFFNLTVPEGGIQPDIIGLYIDGACPGNGQPWARGAYGIYFGENSRYNEYGVLPGGPTPTSQRAELWAAIMAMEKIIACWSDHNDIDEYIVVTDSTYLVNSISSYIDKWKANGWITAAGRDVANQDLIKRLDNLLGRYSNQGIYVYFWAVPRSETEDADALANRALYEFE